MPRTYTGPADYEARNPYLVIVHTYDGPEIEKAFSTRKAAQNYADQMTLTAWVEVMTRRQFAATQTA